MAMVLATSRGVLCWRAGWEREPCALTCPGLLAAEGERLIMADIQGRMLDLGGSTVPIDRDAERLLLWRGHPLVLSSDTNALTLLSRKGRPLISVPAGLYPQDMCQLGERLAVCGGTDGQVHLLTLPELFSAGDLEVPGAPQRVCRGTGGVFVLSALEEAGMRTLLLFVPMNGGKLRPMCVLPGLPGALAADEQGGVWAAAGEALYHFPQGSAAPDQTHGGFGLIRYLSVSGRWALASDPVEGMAVLADAEGEMGVRVLYEGEVGEGLFW